MKYSLRMKALGKLTMDELLIVQKRVEENPENKNTLGGIHRFTPEARRKLEDIARVIQQKMTEAKSK